MTTETQTFENPAQVDRIERSTTKDGKPIINFFTEPLEFSWCSLFESQFGLLLAAGIDPNQLQPGQPHYTNFLAHWKIATNGDGKPKINSKGNPYKLIEKIEPLKATADPILIRMQADIEAVKAMLEFLINNQEMTRPEPTPAPEPAEEEPPAPAEAKEELFNLTYRCGNQKVDIDNPAELAAFNAYKRANGEKAPYSKAALRKWSKPIR